MRRRWYLVPVAVFIVSFLIAGSMAFRMRLDIRAVMDTAAKNDWPIVVTDSGDSLFPFAVYTLDGKRGLLATLVLPAEIRYVLFENDGSLVIFTSSSLDRESSVFYRIDFLDYRPRRVRMPPPNIPEGCGRSYWNPMYQSPRYACENFGSRSDMLILDLLDGNATVLRFKAEPPWTAGAVERETPIWTDRSDMFFWVRTKSAATAASAPPPSIDSYWRYDGSAGTWTRLAEGSFLGAAIGKDGKIIALGISSPPSSPRVEFMDATTGQVLHTVDTGYGAAIGRRWAVCTRFVGTHNTRELLLFDIQNNWESPWTAVGGRPGHPHSNVLAIFEPGASGSQE